MSSTVERAACEFVRRGAAIVLGRYGFHTWVALLALLHIWFSVTLGAVTWVDSASFLRLSAVWHDRAAYIEAHNGPLLWWHNYIAFGMPWLWELVSWFPEHLAWPLLALIQHLFALCALVYFSEGLVRYLGCVPAIIRSGAVLLSLVPFYQSFHSAYLTESFSSSFLLVLLGIVVRVLARDGRLQTGHFLVLCTCVLALTQFRANLALIGLATACLALWSAVRTRSLLPSSLLIGVFAVGLSAYPAYRYAFTGEFALPRKGLSALMAGLWVNPTPSGAVLEAFSVHEWPAVLLPEAFLANGLDYAEVEKVARFWRDRGDDNPAIMGRAEMLGASLRDDGLLVRARALSYGLVSSGFVVPFWLSPADFEVFRGMFAREQAAHQYQHYRFLGWVNVDRAQNDWMFESFFLGPEGSVEHHRYVRMWSPYVSSFGPGYRDPLRLVWVPFDAWSVSGVLAIIFLALLGCVFSRLLLVAVSLNILVYASIPFAGIRYAYPFLPLYLLMIAALASRVLEGQQRRRAHVASSSLP